MTDERQHDPQAGAAANDRRRRHGEPKSIPACVRNAYLLDWPEVGHQANGPLCAMWFPGYDS